jgi:hypothetical protein
MDQTGKLLHSSQKIFSQDTVELGISHFSKDFVVDYKSIFRVLRNVFDCTIEVEAVAELLVVLENSNDIRGFVFLSAFKT